MKRWFYISFQPLILAGLIGAALAAERREVIFNSDAEHPLALDLYYPAKPTSEALLVYVHGGAWRSGSKSEVPLLGLVESGFVLASVDYRLTPEAKFPANAHDLKAAIRFLRAKQGELGIKADRIVIIGSSAGGHLAALVGVTNGHRELEGRIGDHLDQSSDVQGIVSFYGASNLETILAQSTPQGLSVRVPALELLLGAGPGKAPELARLASPVAHVDANDPPLLLIHGDQDPQMPVNQSLELQAVYEANKLRVEFINVHGGGHSGPQFYVAAMLDRVERFIRQLVAD